MLACKIQKIVQIRKRILVDWEEVCLQGNLYDSKTGEQRALEEEK